MIFFHGDIHEEIYMKVLPWFHVDSPSYVCKLHNSIYGLKQASTKWYSKLSSTLHIYGYHHSTNDYSLFLIGSQISNLNTYLDDTFKSQYLSRWCFQNCRSGWYVFFIGLKLNTIEGGMVLHQYKFIQELFQFYSIIDASPAATPLPSNVHLPICILLVIQLYIDNLLVTLTFFHVLWYLKEAISTINKMVYSGTYF